MKVCYIIRKGWLNFVLFDVRISPASAALRRSDSVLRHTASRLSTRSADYVRMDERRKPDKLDNLAICEQQ